MSQIAAHAPFGGVVPEIAARAHVEIIDLLIARALKRAQVAAKDLDGVAAAAGPGLIGGVLVGLMAGKGVALACGKPFVAVNHLEAHALTARLTESVAFPFLVLIASGGHTQILAVKGVGDYDRLGATMDDAIGEAFDKTAKLLGLPFPGGPAVEAAAEGGDPTRFALPRPLLGRPDADFSLSGLKTALRLAAESVAPLRPRDVADLCASFQAAVVDVVEDRIRIGLKLFRRRIGVAPRAVVVAGGVAANRALREALTRFCAESGLPLVAPPQKLCTDNGAMIAWAGVERLRLGMIDRARRARSAELAARPQIRARAQQQGLKRRRTAFLPVRLRRRLGLGGRRRRRRLLLRLLVGEMAADNAAADRADNPVMAGVMAGDAADERALQAALGLGGRGSRSRRQRQSEGGEDCVFHERFRCSAGRSPNSEVRAPFGLRPDPWQEPGTHFGWLTGVRAAHKHCNFLGPCLYNAFPLKFDPLRPRLAKPASARKRSSRSFRS